MKQCLSAAILLSCMVGGAAWAQAPAAASQPAFGNELPYTEELSPPSITGDRMPLTLRSELPRSNFVSGDLRFTTGFDDNALMTPGNRVSDTSYMLLPTLDIGQSRERWRWDFSYGLGLTINQHMSERNQSAHNLNLIFDYRLTPHVGIRLRENYAKTSSIFTGQLGNPLQPGVGPLQSPNTSLAIPVADRTGNTSAVDLTYQFSASSLVGLGGNYNFSNYGPVAGTISSQSSLIDSRSAGSTAFYAHRFANRQWAGIVLNAQRLMFDSGGRTDVVRSLLFYSIPVTSHVTLSMWAGPEHSTSRGTGIPPSMKLSNRSRLAAAGGLSFLVEGDRNSFRADYVRQTSDGGGLTEGVAMQRVDAEVRRRMGARWTASANVGYGLNDPLDTVTGASKYRSLLAGAGMGYKLRDNFSLGLSYARQQQHQENNLAPSALTNSNRVFFSLSYSFLRPLGR